MRTGLAAAGSSLIVLEPQTENCDARSPFTFVLARVAGWVIAGAALTALIPIHLAARPSSTSPKLLPKHLKALPWAAPAENAASAAPATLISDDQDVSAEPRKGDRLEYVLVNRDRQGVTMSGSSQDAERLKRKYGDERLLSVPPQR